MLTHFGEERVGGSTATITSGVVPGERNHVQEGDAHKKVIWIQ